MSHYLKSSPWTVTSIQFSTTIISLIGLLLCHVGAIDILEIILGYFLFSCVGISVFYHRYYSHRSFKTNRCFRWIGTVCGILAGRGSPVGWAAVHRQHHKHADKELDPHPPCWKVFVPHLLNYKSNHFAIKDFLADRAQMNIDKYYNLLIFIFVAFLSEIDSRLLFFFWIVPVAMTGWALNLFVFLNHLYGYRTFQTEDDSTNNWFISLILWGEGWHNNHHHDTKSWNLHFKWWEIDPSAFVIHLIKTNN